MYLYILIACLLASLIYKLIQCAFPHQKDHPATSFIESCQYYDCKYGKCLGLRKKGTLEGKWTGAFVLCAKLNDKTISALYENNKEIIYTDDNWRVHAQIYHKCISEDWEPMSRSDITKTARI